MKTINLILGAQLLAATLAAAVPLADGAVAKTGSTLSSPGFSGQRFALKVRENAVVVAEPEDASNEKCDKAKREATATAEAAAAAYNEFANALSK